MTRKGPLVQIVTGAVLMALAAALAFLMMVRIIPPSLGLSFLAYGLSVGGFVTGIIGAQGYFRPPNRDQDR